MKIWRSFKSYQAVDGDGDSKTEQSESSKTETESLKITKLCKDPRDAPILCKKLRKLIKNKTLSEKVAVNLYGLFLSKFTTDYHFCPINCSL
jgi:hypothetical protein